jgi:hypothetical protein
MGYGRLKRLFIQNACLGTLTELGKELAWQAGVSIESSTGGPSADF